MSPHREYILGKSNLSSYLQVQSVMGLSPELFAHLWDKMAFTSELPCKRRLEANLDSDLKLKFEVTNSSDDVAMIGGEVVDSW